MDGGDCIIGGGGCTVCRFRGGGLGRKRGGGVFEGVDTPMHTVDCSLDGSIGSRSLKGSIGGRFSHSYGICNPGSSPPTVDVFLSFLSCHVVIKLN